MIDRGKRSIAGVNVDVIDYDGAVSRVMSAAATGRPCAVSALAVHGVMTGVQDPAHRHRLNSLDLCVPDGQPVRWALRLLHGEVLKSRVYGPELTLRLCERAALDRQPVYFYGSKPDVLEALRDNLKAQFPGLIIAGMEPSRFRRVDDDENAAILDAIRASGAKLVFAGLGCPRQEVWAFENSAALSMPVVAVGAAFDFHAGLLSQAPGWMQDRGLEWLYRLAVEPRRLWRRYVLLNPAFCWHVGLQYLGLRRYPADDAPEPGRRHNYA